jgi:hypothetical protein
MDIICARWCGDDDNRQEWIKVVLSAGSMQVSPDRYPFPVIPY